MYLYAAQELKDAMDLAQRPADVLKMHADVVRNGAIVVPQNKTGSKANSYYSQRMRFDAARKAAIEAAEDGRPK